MLEPVWVEPPDPSEPDPAADESAEALISAVTSAPAKTMLLWIIASAWATSSALMAGRPVVFINPKPIKQ